MLEDKYQIRSWAIYAASNSEIAVIQREVDHVFSGYSFYPEVEWKLYGYLPPDKYQVLGAWRHPQTKVFAFLLDNRNNETSGTALQLLLHIAGDISEIIKLDPRIDDLKKNLNLSEKKGRVNLHYGTRLDRLNKTSLGILTGILTIFAGIINGFALYLRKIHPPQFSNKLFIDIYNWVVLVVHFSALFLLLILILICGAFLIKYGILLIRRI
jgi:hypothetical protein